MIQVNLSDEKADSMVRLYKPRLEDLWFRKEFMGDEETMSY